jgi:hypothetical protein
MTCRAVGYPHPVYKWLFNGQDANNIVEDSPGQSILRISYADWNEEGIYTCIASNSRGKDDYDSPLKVRGKTELEDVITKCIFNYKGCV